MKPPTGPVRQACRQGINLVRRGFQLPSTYLKDRREWSQRIADVMNCPDNARIPRQADAGRVVNGFQIMHNGQKVRQHGYYGWGITELLRENQGCHEPQEELVFQEVISRLPSNAQMLELGAYWAFYSMWFLQNRPNRTAWLIEPCPENLLSGVINFAENGLIGNFVAAGIGSETDSMTSFPVITIDSFLEKRGIQGLDILHADIQGHEAVMLGGAEKTLARKAVKFLFISTHSDSLHAECKDILLAHNYLIHTDIPLSGSYSYDGIIVAAADAVAPQLPSPTCKPIVQC